MGSNLYRLNRYSSRSLLCRVAGPKNLPCLTIPHEHRVGAVVLYREVRSPTAASD
jgi:hypothetical protein